MRARCVDVFGVNGRDLFVRPADAHVADQIPTERDDVGHGLERRGRRRHAGRRRPRSGRRAVLQAGRRLDVRRDRERPVGPGQAPGDQAVGVHARPLLVGAPECVREVVRRNEIEADAVTEIDFLDSVFNVLDARAEPLDIVEGDRTGDELVRRGRSHQFARGEPHDLRSLRHESAVDEDGRVGGLLVADRQRPSDTLECVCGVVPVADATQLQDVVVDVVQRLKHFSKHSTLSPEKISSCTSTRRRHGMFGDGDGDR